MGFGDDIPKQVWAAAQKGSGEHDGVVHRPQRMNPYPHSSEMGFGDDIPKQVWAAAQKGSGEHEGVVHRPQRKKK